MDLAAIPALGGEVDLVSIQGGELIVTVTYQKSQFLDTVYLQQDAFGRLVVSAGLP